LISKSHRSGESQENSVDLNFDTLQQKLTQSELTLEKAAILSSIAAASSSSPLSLHNFFSTPPSTTHISTIIPILPIVAVLPDVPFIPANMAN